MSLSTIDKKTASGAAITATAEAETERLLAAAQQETGLSDWGPHQFIEPLQVLVDSMIGEAQLKPEVLERELGRLKNLLCNRLRLQADRTKHAEIAAEKIVRPIIILGVPRSGTTQLHALLARDPDNRAPLQWEMLLPSPPPERATYDSDPRIARVNKMLEERGLMSEKLRAIHPFHAQLPEECSSIFEHCFMALNFCATMPLPSYRRYREQGDYRPVYAYHHDYLQHLQWRCAGARWVLKAPEHLLHLDTLLETYPDAIVVQTHRDPAKVLPSNMDLICNLARDNTTRPDVEAILRDECLHNWSYGVEKTWDLRKNPDIDRHCIDIYFDEIIREPLAAIARIYDFAGIEFRPAVRHDIEDFLENDTASKHGKHAYSMEDMGFTHAEIDTLFADYLHHYNLRRA
jgi:hypothetical protein